MRGFNTGDGLERRLQAQRPRPREAFVDALSIRVRESRGARPAGPARVAVAAALTLGMLAALGAVGGLGYAASAAKEAASAVFTPNEPDSATGGARISAGGDEYVPGYGFGDENHNHTGPPGLTVPAAFRPIPRAACRTRTGSVVRTRINVDEQADLFFSVIGPNGRPVVLSQRRSSIGQGVSGPPTRTIRYRVLVPRTIPVQLNIPRRQLVCGRVYRIRIVARDPDGNRSTRFIRFRT
jgi:hypothetical protein